MIKFDKGKLVERQGRKATGLTASPDVAMIAGLPNKLLGLTGVILNIGEPIFFNYLNSF
jgi:hypothetical protein